MPEFTPPDRSVPPKFDYDAFSLPENVSLDFILGPHGTVKDLPDPVDFDALLRTTDVLVPEFVHEEETKHIFSGIAQGKRKDFDLLKKETEDPGGWFGGIGSALYASRKAVANIDIDYDSAPMQAHFEAYDVMGRIGIENVRENPDLVRSVIYAYLDSIMRRDQQMLQNLRPELDATIDQNRNLSEKRKLIPLSVRLMYGTAHRSLFDAVTHKNTLDPTQGFSAQIISHQSEHDPMPVGYEKFIRGQELTVQDLERMFAVTIFGNHVQDRRYIGDEPSGVEISDAYLEIEPHLDTTDLEYLTAQIDAFYQSQS